MTKQLFFALIAMFLLQTEMYAQVNIEKCGTDEANKKRMEEYPWIKDVNNQLEEFTKEFSQQRNGQNQRSRNNVYIIPIVFHIVHNYGPEYISDEQVYDAVRILNEDFRKRSADTSSIAPAFKDIAADIEIEFRLPLRDPRGNPTNGINRYQSMTTYNGSDDVKIQSWPRDMYLNVWVVNSFERQGLLGYTYIPASVEGIGGLIDGIVQIHTTVGSIGTGSAASGLNRTLTHEVGHWLNLLHTWGQTNEPGVACGDDGVFDTPITQGAFSCNLNQTVCTPGIPENVQNHMDYSGCPRMFTEGQKDRMLAALNSNVSGRNNLWSEYTLNYTGAALSNNTNTAPPIADFNLENKSVCVGQPITIKDFSWRGPITNWEWTFENATPSVSGDKNPTVSFNNTGWQKVSLTVTNANGTHTTVKENFIFVRDNFVQQFRENFEDATFVANNYVPENYANNESKWELTDKASYTGGLSYVLNNFDVEIYDIDAFTTPEYDLTSSFVSDLSFKYSLATKASYADEIKDRLRVFYSTDCGETWRVMYNEQGLQLITAGNTSQYFVPNREEQWREVRVQIPNLAFNNGSAMFKFEFTRDRYSNNLYIDDINLDDAYTSINEMSEENTNLSVYPNPTRGNVTVSLNIPSSENGNVKIFDMTGKLVFETQKSFSAGENKFSINEKLSSGIYQLNVLAGRNTFQKKLQIIAE